MVCESPRLFWLKVSCSASTTARKVWKPASLARVREDDTVGACGEARPLAADLLAVAEEPHAPRLGDGRGDRHLDLDQSSPTRAVAGECSRWTMTSSAAPRPTTNVSIWMPRAAASAASDWPRPVVSLPSLTARSASGCRRGRARRPGGAPADVGRRARAPTRCGRCPPARTAGVRRGLRHRRRRRPPDRRPIAIPAPRARRPARLAAGGRRCRQVDDEDGRQPIDGRDDLQPGEGQHERGQDRRSQDASDRRRRPRQGDGGRRSSAAASPPAGRPRSRTSGRGDGDRHQPIIASPDECRGRFVRRPAGAVQPASRRAPSRS
jgi:hypothetical protein